MAFPLDLEDTINIKKTSQFDQFQSFTLLIYNHIRNVAKFFFLLETMVFFPAA